MTQIPLIFVVIITTLSYLANAQGPPPPGYFSQGRRPPGPPPPHYLSHAPPGSPSSGYPPRGPPHSYKSKPSSNLLGWLGSRMPAFLSGGSRYPSKLSPKPSYPPPGTAGPPPSYGSAVLMPMSSPFGRPGVIGSQRAQLYGQKPSSVTYYTTTSTVTKDPLRPGQDLYSSTPLQSMGTFPVGSPPPMSYISASPQFRLSSSSQSQPQQIKFMTSSGSLYSAAPSAVPKYSSYIEPQVQSSEHSYQTHGRVVQSYSPVAPAPPPQSNIEVVPSQMVSYNQETLSTGHPEYHAALAGMESSQSPMTVPSPTSQYNPYYPVYNDQAEQYGYPQQQQEASIDMDQLPQYASERLDSSGNQVPMFDLNLGQGQEAYQLHTSVGKSNEGQESVNLEDILSSLRGQYGDQAQFQVQNHGDVQGQYSHQHEVAVAPPQPSASPVAGSSQQQQVQIMSQGSEQGNPVFEILADANAPLYNGHPFDINQLISMIEPGAQVEGSGASASENHETYAQPPQVTSEYQDSNPQGMRHSFLTKHRQNISNQLTHEIETLNQTSQSSSSSDNDSKSLSSIRLNNGTIKRHGFTDTNGNNVTLQKLLTEGNDSVVKDFPMTLPKDDDFDVLTFGHPETNASSSQRFPRPSQQNSFSVSVSSSISNSSRPSRFFNNPKRAFRFPVDSIPSVTSSPSPVVYNSIKPHVTSNNDKMHPNHNYKASPSVTSRDMFFPVTISGLIPTINPFFDTISAEEEGDRDLLESEGDLAASGSHQIRAYAITVTPPTHLLEMTNKFVAARSTSAIEEISTATISPTEIVVDLLQPSKVVTRKVLQETKFPIYQKKSREHSSAQ